MAALLIRLLLATYISDVAKATLPSLIAVGRIQASIDPHTSARAIINSVKGAQLIKQNLSDDASCAEVVAVQLPLGSNDGSGAGQILYYVKDKVASFGDASLQDYSQQQQNEFELEMLGNLTYETMNDNHDGYHFANAFNTENIARDERFTLEALVPPNKPWPMAALDVFIPGTIFNYQVFADWSNDTEVLKPHARAGWENCRNETQASERGRTHFWWKTTQSAVVPSEQGKWVVEHLGATHVHSPFPETEAGKNCTLATWTNFEGRDFMLHFVNSPEFAPGRLKLAAWEAAIKKLRDFKRGLDGWAWNRVVFWADDLDPFVELWRAKGTDYIARSHQELTSKKVVFSLIVSSTSGLVYELRSHHLTLETNVEFWDTCHPSVDSPKTEAASLTVVYVAVAVVALAVVLVGIVLMCCRRKPAGTVQDSLVPRGASGASLVPISNA